MFKSAATKIAHNSTIPSLAGNKELRPLQDLITAEKAVLVSLQSLSNDFTKASEALRTWGLGEGDDLGDTLSASTALLLAYSSALNAFASSHLAIRSYMKNIRTAEETLDEMKRRRKSLHAKADAAERKLSKMGPEHKSLATQTDLLTRLRDEIRMVETEIVEGESKLGDDKRMLVKQWMNVKWGALAECCEKGMIAAEYGRLIISGIPETQTPPGMPRVVYYGHQKTESLVNEAQREINNVPPGGSGSVNLPIAKAAVPDIPGSALIGRSDGQIQLPPLPLVYNADELEKDYPEAAQPPEPSYGQPSSSLYEPPPTSLNQPQSPFIPSQPPTSYSASVDAFSNADNTKQGSGSGFLPAPQIGTGIDTGLGMGHFIDASDFSGVGSNSTNSNLNFLPGSPTTSQPNRSIDDFGVVHNTSLGGAGGGVASGGHFATFPVKARAGASAGLVPSATGGDAPHRDDTPPSLGNHPHGQEPSFSTSIAEALEPPAVGDNTMNSGPTSNKETPSVPDEPSPPYELGSTLENPWNEERNRRRRSGVSDISAGTGDIGLAYDRDGSEGGRSRKNSETKHVRFGEVSDVEEELEKRHQNETRSQGGYALYDGLSNQSQPIGMQPPASFVPGSPSYSPTTPTPGSKMMDTSKGTDPYTPTTPTPPYSLYPDTAPPNASQELTSGTATSVDAQPPSPLSPLPRIQPPSFDSREEERQLNAAAAREVSRELDALNFSPPSLGDHGTRTSGPPPRDRSNSFEHGRGGDVGSSGMQRMPFTEGYQSQQSYGSGPPSPLAPPAPAFAAGRSVSPIPRSRPSLDTTTNRAGSPQGHPSPIPPGYASPTNTSPISTRPGYGYSTPTLNLPDSQQDSGSSLNTNPRSISPLSANSPFRTPPEFPSPRLGLRSASSQGSMGGGSPLPSPTPGTKTISAAAFRRPVPRKMSGANEGGLGVGVGSPSLSPADTSPLVLKKRLPSSPYPQRPGQMAGVGAGVGAGRDRAGSSSGMLQSPGAPAPQRPGQGQLQEGDGEEFDYISAYVNSPGIGEAGTPKAEFGTFGRKSGGQENEGGNTYEGGGGGYAGGRFATNLEGESLR